MFNELSIESMRHHSNFDSDLFVVFTPQKFDIFFAIHEFS